MTLENDGADGNGEAGAQQLIFDATASRRDFIRNTLVGGAALAVTACADAGDEPAGNEGAEEGAEEGADQSADQTPEAEPTGSESGLTLEDIKGAERVAGVAYTEEQRGFVLENIEGQYRALRAIQEYEFDNGLPPAPHFDPRLPGVNYAAQQNSVILANGNAGNLPANPEDIAFAPTTALSHWVQTRQISSVELTELYLSRIETYAEKLECFVTVTADLARAEAVRADAELAAGNNRGALHGIPYGLKDLADTEGIRTTWGAEPFKERIASRDARVVTKLREAGAVLLGKTTCGALAFGDVWFGGMTRSPWNTDEGSSGSSAGSGSSTAAGLVGFSIGTETLGSIISPANRNGVAGLRPTYGRVSRAGFMALAWSLDKVGPLCRSVEDCALVLAAVNGADPGDPSSRDMGFAYEGGMDVSGLRVGYIPSAFEDENTSDIDRAALEAAGALGLNLVEVMLPDLPTQALGPIIRAESGAAFDQFTRSGEVDRLRLTGRRGRGTGWRTSRLLSAVDYVNMERLRRLVMQRMHEVFENVDVIIGPNYASNMLSVTNYTGHPQLAFRAGFFDTPTRTIFGSTEEGDEVTHRVPQNFSVFGKLYGEGPVLAVGRAMEAAMGAAAERPELTT